MQLRRISALLHNFSLSDRKLIVTNWNLWIWAWCQFKIQSFNRDIEWLIIKWWMEITHKKHCLWCHVLSWTSTLTCRLQSWHGTEPLAQRTGPSMQTVSSCPYHVHSCAVCPIIDMASIGYRFSTTAKAEGPTPTSHFKNQSTFQSKRFCSA